MKKYKLVLEDGFELRGNLVGYEDIRAGKIAIYPGASGYQEILTNPAAYNQLAIFSFPIMGNYGINRDDYESIQPHVSGVIVRDCTEYPSHYKMNKNLHQYLEKMKVTGIELDDVRGLSKYVQDKKIEWAIIVPEDYQNIDALNDLHSFKAGCTDMKKLSSPIMYEIPGNGKRLALIDLGLKQSLLKKLNEFGFHITIMPWDCTWEQIVDLDPDAIFLSSGPYLEEVLLNRSSMLKSHREELPMFGCGFGGLILASVWGCDLYKKDHGLRGSHAVKNLVNNEIFFTSFNLDYLLKEVKPKETGLEIASKLVNKDFIVGYRHKDFPVYGCLYEPEGAPGPDEGKYFFNEIKEILLKES